MVFPRVLLSEARKRRELSRTGVYILLGPPEESGLPRVYVGEGDAIKPRLEQHAAKKDFWTTCIAFTSKDENLNKAHVQFIESRLVELAANAKRCVLDNGNIPALPSLSEADAADAEGFLAEILLCCPLLGLSVFSTTAASPKAGRQLFISAKGIKAQGVESPKGFVVHAGSEVVKTEVPSCPAHANKLRAALVANGVLKPSDGGFVFTQDYAFDSPSTAAAVVQGRNANGRIDWKLKDGTTLKDLQEAQAKA